MYQSSVHSNSDLELIRRPSLLSVIGCSRSRKDGATSISLVFLILAKCWPCGDSCKSAESSMQDSLNVARETEFNLSATNTCSKCCIHSSMQAKLTIWQLCTTPCLRNCVKINCPFVEQIRHIGTVVFSSERSSLHYDTPLSWFLLSRCSSVKPVIKLQ